MAQLAVHRVDWVHQVFCFALVCLLTGYALQVFLWGFGRYRFRQGCLVNTDMVSVCQFHLFPDDLLNCRLDVALDHFYELIEPLPVLVNICLKRRNFLILTLNFPIEPSLDLHQLCIKSLFWSLFSQYFIKSLDNEAAVLELFCVLLVWIRELSNVVVQVLLELYYFLGRRQLQCVGLQFLKIVQSNTVFELRLHLKNRVLLLGQQLCLLVV